VTDQTLRPFDDGLMVGEAASRAAHRRDGGRTIGGRHQRDVFRSAHVAQVFGLCQYEGPPRLQGLDLGKLLATILDKHIVQQHPEFGRTVRMSRPIRKFIAFSSPLLLGIPPVDHRNFWGKITKQSTVRLADQHNHEISIVEVSGTQKSAQVELSAKAGAYFGATTEIAKSLAIFITRKTRSISRISPPAAIHQAWRDAACHTARSSSSCMTPGASFGPPGVTNIESNAAALGLWLRSTRNLSFVKLQAISALWQHLMPMRQALDRTCPVGLLRVPYGYQRIVSGSVCPQKFPRELVPPSIGFAF
jgi:hypothetical protein